MSILYDKTSFIKDVKPPRVGTSQHPTTINTASRATLRTLSRFCAYGSIVDVCFERHRNRYSGHFFVGWNIVWNQDLHIADIAHHEARDAHQQRHAAKQHKHETVSYTHLRAHETRHDLVCRLLLEKKKKNKTEKNEIAIQQEIKKKEQKIEKIN